jgi:hypothetical protein
MAGDNETFPYRTVSETVECQFEQMRFRLLLSYYPNGRIGEITVSGFKDGSALNEIVQDACAIISELLNRFVSPLTLAELVNRKPDGAPASIIGAIVLQITEQSLEE